MSPLGFGSRLDLAANIVTSRGATRHWLSVRNRLVVTEPTPKLCVLGVVAMGKRKWLVSASDVILLAIEDNVIRCQVALHVPVKLVVCDAGLWLNRLGDLRSGIGRRFFLGVPS
ncbi:MAG: hypothetical protein OSA88_12135 [Acidimicrobiales bacterium]|nr:hypothetical protein [Acidimicrobiales bacterium]